MEFTRFVFWTAIKALGLILLGLLSAKAIAALCVGDGRSGHNRLVGLRVTLYLVVLALVGGGAWFVGNDVAAENYMRVSVRDLGRRQMAMAYANAARAVELRPSVLRYWQALASAKLAQRQYASVVADLPIFLSLGRGRLDEEDGYRLAVSYYFLAQYDKVFPLTQAMIRENRTYAAPYVLEGYTYLSQKRYAEAKRVFLSVLQMFPTHQAAVEGLAHAHFLEGDRAAALAVLDQTAQFSFAPEVRQRFEALKALYVQ